MTTAATDQYRHDYAHWLRTGRWLRPYGTDGRELKFNPYHDPFNGQFTFAPGGPRSLSRIIVSDREGRRSWIEAPPKNDALDKRSEDPTAEGPPDDELNKKLPTSRVQLAARGRDPRVPRGGRRPPADPRTLEQVFPGLRTAVGGAVIAVAEGVFDFTGPATELTSQLYIDLSRAIQAETRA